MLQVGDVSHKLIENLGIVTYYAFRIVAKDHTGKQDYCEVLVKTLRDCEYYFRLEIKSCIRLLSTRKRKPTCSLLTPRF